MPSLKHGSFHSRNYEVVVDSLYGVHCIRRRSNGYTTLLFTCGEGFDDYCKLKAAWRTSRRIFESLCMEYIYHP